MSSNSPASLLSLPPEIRLKIYRLLLCSDTSLCLRKWTRVNIDYPFNKLFPSILRTNRLIYYEAVAVLYSENYFLAHAMGYRNTNYSLIKRVHFYLPWAGIMTLRGGKLASLFRHFPNVAYIKYELQPNYGLNYDGHVNILLWALKFVWYMGEVEVCTNDEKEVPVQLYAQRFEKTLLELATKRDKHPEEYETWKKKREEALESRERDIEEPGPPNEKRRWILWRLKTLERRISEDWMGGGGHQYYYTRESEINQLNTILLEGSWDKAQVGPWSKANKALIAPDAE
ncbi:hypothetical protein FQN49_006827 [Arthroderma sp. PD_2]|nr:hypothetical protein FQN49_006827 [Arthroderma sp. PD_2]